MRFVLTFLAIVGFFLAATVMPTQAAATTYYVDCSAGLDTNNGTSTSTAWKSLEKVHSGNFVAGDSILLKKGCSWDTGVRGGSPNSSGLIFIQSGTSAQPITLSSYGTGAKPVLINSYNATRFSRIIKIEGSNWVINDLAVQNGIEHGIEVAATASNTTLTHLDISGVGTGVNIIGNGTKLLNSEVHDTKMIVATNNGGDDDYGATAVVIASSNNEIAFNKFYNNVELSPDYGVDGGAVEFFTWDAITDIGNTKIHHNWMENNAVITEMGSSNHGAIHDISFYHNVMINNGTLLTLHTDATWGAQVSNITFDHNTVYENKSEWEYSSTRGNPMLVWFSGSATSSTLLMRNNIIYSTQGTEVANVDTFTHQNNIWYMPSRTQNFAFTASELTSDPLFTSIASKDFTLQTSSPAINSGLSLNYATDYANVAIPVDSYDRGAYEFASAVSPLPTASPESSPSIPPVESECSRANINQQGLVDLVDYSILSSNFFVSPPAVARADINQDEAVNLLDYSILATHFFKTCS